MLLQGMRTTKRKRKQSQLVMDASGVVLLDDTPTAPLTVILDSTITVDTQMNTVKR